MPAGVIQSYMANGTILPYSFVKFDSGTPAPFKVIQAAANSDILLGIAQEFTDTTPLPAPYSAGGTNAAIVGEQVRVYRVGCQCLLKIGAGGCTVGDRLTSDASGSGVTATSGQIAGAIARDTRVAGELCDVIVIEPMKI
jgi:hypothetical protein